MGLMFATTPFTGWDWYRRKTSRSFCSNAVRFFSLGVYCGRHFPCELLPQSLVHRFQQPVIVRMGVDQDHRIVSEPRLLDVDVLAVARVFLRPLQHTVHRVEVEGAEHGRDHTALRNALFPVRLQHDLQQG